MEFCLICKEIVDGQFKVRVSDTKVGSSFAGSVCRFCYNKFVESSHDKGFFKLAKMVNWMKKKDPMRYL